MPRATTNPQSTSPLRLLMIAAAYPPTGGSGVQRPAKFAKYLARQGWSVDVWSAMQFPGLPLDPTLLNDEPAGVSRLGLPALPQRPFLTLLSAPLRALGYPDALLPWMLASLIPLYRHLKRSRPDVILATYSPPSNLVLAHLLSRCASIPWVADFRDLWTDDCTYAQSSRLLRLVHAATEHALIRSAACVIAASTRQAQLLQRRDLRRANKFITITNGFDPEDFHGSLPARAAPTNPSSTFSASPCSLCAALEDVGAEAICPPAARPTVTLVHAGRLERQRFTPSILQGFRRFASAQSKSAPLLRLRIVGHANPSLQSELLNSGLAVECTDLVCHAHAIDQMCRADWLLLPGAHGKNSDSLIPGKSFEYMAARRPIWFIGPSTAEIWQRISACCNACRCDATSESVAAALHRIAYLPSPLSDCAAMNSRLLNSYARQTLTHTLDSALRQLVRAARRTVDVYDGGAVQQPCRQ